MKKFNRLIMGNEEVFGVGYFRKFSDGLIIEAENASVLKHFINVMSGNAFIGSISFQGEGTDSSFGGDFLVSNISGNTVTLIKV